MLGKLLNVIKEFLKSRKKRVVLNGQFSSWADVDAGVPQRSILCPLLFFMYSNNLANDLSLTTKLFADGAWLFSVVFNVDTSGKELNDDLVKVQDLELRWKISCSPNISEQAQKIFFSRKLKNSTSSHNV